MGRPSKLMSSRWITDKRMLFETKRVKLVYSRSRKRFYRNLLHNDSYKGYIRLKCNRRHIRKIDIIKYNKHVIEIHFKD